jgi:DNA-binding transcriptional ArsR family regulator
MSVHPHVFADMAPHEHPVRPDQVAAARSRVLSPEQAAEVTGVLGLVADPVRARVLDALAAVPELCVGDLALALDVSEDAAGYALRILRTAGLVSARKEGRMVFYRLASGFPEPLFDHCLRLLSALPKAQEDGA